MNEVFDVEALWKFLTTTTSFHKSLEILSLFIFLNLTRASTQHSLINFLVDLHHNEFSFSLIAFIPSSAIVIHYGKLVGLQR